MGILTISDLRTKRDILGGGALDLLLGRHCNQSSNARKLGGGSMLNFPREIDPKFKVCGEETLRLSSSTLG